jgi:tRNA A-37 threonylcarbamoyl transferase component Bud32
MVPTVPAEATQDALLGTTLSDRYQVTRLIGRGGMGVVYEAVHVALQKRIAIKLLLDKYADDHEAVERFHREALTATHIGDDHIIDVLDVGTTPEGKSFVVLEYLDGQDLGKVLAATGPMPASRAVHVIQQVLRGLGAAHAKGIVHRDMKPDNVFIVPHSETPDFVKILDFGISKIMAAQDAKVRLTATGTVVGTPIYMAPEQALGTGVDHRADLYSVGVMLFELLAGKPPFYAESYLALVTQHLQATPPDLGQIRPDLPPSLVHVVHRALAKEPDHRFRTAAEMARALPSPSALRHAEGLGATYGSGAMPSYGTPSPSPHPGAVAAVSAPRRAGADPRGVRSRRRLVIGAVLAAAAIAVATRPSGTATAQGGGRLKVETTPSGVKVYVDDELVGTTPIELTNVAVGRHRVRLERDGFVSMSTTTQVAAGENASIIVGMTEQPPLPAPPIPAAATGSGSGSGSGAGSATPSRPPKGGSRRERPSDKPSAATGADPLNPYGDGSAYVPPAVDKQPDKQPDKPPRKGSDPGSKPNPYDE